LFCFEKNSFSAKSVFSKVLLELAAKVCSCTGHAAHAAADPEKGTILIVES
jgi:hypothetical protein